MSATPGAKNEYSRGSGGSGRGSGSNFGRSGPPWRRHTDEVERGARGPILTGALLGTLLLIVAEFTSLYQVHLATSSVPIKTVSGGSNHSYAILVIGLGAGALGLEVWRSGSRPALLAIGALGVVALLIALLGDLPDAHATGLSGSATRGYVSASSTPSAGLYLETLGAVLLIATCGLGFMMLGTLSPRPRGPRPPRRPRPPAGHGGEPQRENGGLGERGVSGGGAPRARSRRKRSNGERGS